MGKEKFDLYEHVTELFIEGLKAGRIPWKKPYTGYVPTNIFSNTGYHGVNNLLLGMLPYEKPYYLTFKQCQKLKGKVKKGSKSHIVVYWNFVKKTEHRDHGEDKEITIPFLRYYRVFNIEQTEGIEFDIPELQVKNNIEKIESAEKIVQACEPPIIYDSQLPYYSPPFDQIHLPQKEQFHSNHDYYSTVFHEIVHSTGHKSRLDRKGISEINGRNMVQYSKEELIAEIGSSFLNHKCGFGDIEQENSQAYINGWITRLQNNPKEIVSAAGKAQKAVDYICK